MRGSALSTTLSDPRHLHRNSCRTLAPGDVELLSLSLGETLLHRRAREAERKGEGVCVVGNAGACAQAEVVVVLLCHDRAVGGGGESSG